MRTLFGNNIDGSPVFAYTIKNDRARAKFIDRGATLVSLEIFGRDVVGGFDTLEDYLKDDSHQGATIGRVANRIAEASFTMDGKLYTLPKNDGENCLHGGDGFDHKVWRVTEHTEEKIAFEYLSHDGEEGFPADLDVRVTYTLEGANLIISYEAVPGAKTPIALTNHTYFNLDGLGSDIEAHKVKIYAERYTEVDGSLIPTGRHLSVKGTPFDFTEEHTIGERLGGGFIGYDHNFVLNPTEHKAFLGEELGLAATVRSDDLKMSVYTDQPGVQFYIGNFLGKGPDFKGGIKQVLHGAFCLETQTEPNCINHGEGFYDAGDVYTHVTAYCFEKI